MHSEMKRFNREREMSNVVIEAGCRGERRREAMGREKSGREWSSFEVRKTVEVEGASAVDIGQEGFVPGE